MAWLAIIQPYEPSGNEILFESLWFNKNIPIMYNNKLYKGGLSQIIDIIDVNTGEFLSYSSLKMIVNINFIEYYALHSAIPSKWKREIKRVIDSKKQSDPPYTLLERMLENKKPTKWAYNMQRQKHEIVLPDNGYVEWNRILNTHINKEQWGTIRVQGHYISLETKLKYFQYRILSRKLVTNVHRFRWHQVDSPICYFCKIEEEKIEHVSILLY